MGRFCAYTLICVFIQIGVLHGQPSVLDSLRFEPVVTGLTKPVDADEFPPGSGRFLITQQEGLIRVFDGRELLAAPFLDLLDRVSCCGELGLLNVALHPRFDSNGLLYVHYTDSDMHTTVSRFSIGDNPDVAEPESELILLTLPQEKATHKGGRLLFGADGYLYIGLGDGGFNEEAQNLGSWYGSILRIDVDGGDPYSVPATNPFVARPGAKAEIWAFGLRNPWSFTFDRLTGDMFIGDVGHLSVEELDFLPIGSGGGQNYGWPVLEGSLCFPEDRLCNPGPFVAPIFEYRHVPDDCASVIAGHRYRGPSMPTLQGTLIFADHCTGQRGQMFAGVHDGKDWVLAGRREVPFNISAFTEDSDGEIYLIDHNRGEIRRIEADPPGPVFISPDGVTNAASFLAGGMVSPGEIVTFFGQGIGPPTLVGLEVIDGFITTELAGARVLFDGIPAPLVHTLESQVTAVVPYFVAGRPNTKAQIEFQGQLSNTVTLDVADAWPGIFTLNASGMGPGAIINQDGTLNSPANPAATGWVISVFATGEGQTAPPGVDGKLAEVPPPTPLLEVLATIGGVDAAVHFAGGAPGLIAGVLQVNLWVPEGIVPGDNVPIVLIIGDATSQPGVTVAIR